MKVELCGRVDHLLEQPHVVYRLFDSAGALLYVGMTHDLAKRIGQHRRIQPWWPEVDESRTVTRTYRSRLSGLSAEAAAIDNEKPRYNSPTGHRRRGEMSESQARELDDARAVKAESDASFRSDILTLMDEGVSYSVMADALSCSKETLRKWKRESGR